MMAKEAELKRRLEEMAEFSNRDEGCLEYTVHQDSDHPTEFIALAKWATKVVHDNHRTSLKAISFYQSLPELAQYARLYITSIEHNPGA